MSTPSSAWSSTVAPPDDERSAVSSASALAVTTSALRICPPSRPTSIRTKSSATRNHLRENAVDGIGMDERELEAEQPAARRPIDHVRAGGVEPLERRDQVLCGDRDVVHSRAAACEEAAHRSVLARRRHELETTVADEDGGRLDALIGDRSTVLEPRAEERLVRRNCFVEIRDGDTEVMNALHGRDAIGAC